MRQKTFIFSLIIIFALLLTACQPGTSTIELPFITIELGNPKNEPAQNAPVIIETAPPSVSTLPGNSAATGDAVAALQGTLTEIYNKVNPSVVNIQVLRAGGGGNGSGFVWDKDGHIVTNNHVVESASQIRVRFSDGTTSNASLVGSDPDSDLAVLKVEIEPEKLYPVTMGDSSSLQVGQLAVAIGTPFGLEGTMTVGIISALGRSLPVENGSLTGGLNYTIPDVIQTDAPINPGNSGGVLLNDRGEVIGVTAAIESPTRSNAGIGYAIPSNIVTRVVPSLIAEGRFEHPWLGISGTTLSSELAATLDLPASTSGAMVIDVTEGSPADRAGLRGSDRQVRIDGTIVRVGGDIITAVDDVTVRTIDDLISYLATKTLPGQDITLQILRDGKQMKVEVTLGSRPTGSRSSAPQVQPTARGGYLGISGMTLFPELAAAVDLDRETRGVLVVVVENGSPADKAGLRGGFKPIVISGREILSGGDVITAIDDQPVESIQGLREALSQYSPGDKVILQILRQGKPMELEVTLGEMP